MNLTYMVACMDGFVYTADAAFRANAINQAIDSVGTPSKLTPSDPVVKLFNEYLKSFGKPPMKLTK
jgi:hypothetical protein